jgi:small neutral amino acid transporter SnatA (MarC family)
MGTLLQNLAVAGGLIIVMYAAEWLTRDKKTRKGETAADKAAHPMKKERNKSLIPMMEADPFTGL